MTCTPAQQAEVRWQLQRKVGCTRQSVNNWSKGTIPISLLVRKIAAKVIGSTLGLNLIPDTLFSRAPRNQTDQA